MKSIISEKHIVDGKVLAESIINDVKTDIADILKWNDEHCHKTIKLPHLAIILVGDNPASSLYVKTKSTKAKELGIEASLYKFPASVNEEDILFLIQTLNSDNDINGIMVQLPLPHNLNTENILNSVIPIKDVDGTASNSKFVPATALAVVRTIDVISEELNINLKDKVATVIGSSKEVGRPVHNLLTSKGIISTVTDKTCKEDSIKDLCSKSDIIVSATGCMSLVKRDWIKDGAVVIDVGITKVGVSASGKAILKGDVDIDNVLDKVSAITPVVGGIGPITISMLMTNIVKAYRSQNLD